MPVLQENISLLGAMIVALRYGDVITFSGVLGFWEYQYSISAVGYSQFEFEEKVFGFPGRTIIASHLGSLLVEPRHTIVMLLQPP